MTQPAKNNPIMLAGVFVLVVAFVLGIGQLSRPRVVAGHALAGSRPATSPSTEPSTPVRPRAVYRKFGLCRICLRELAHQGFIPGMTKSSW